VARPRRSLLTGWHCRGHGIGKRNRQAVDAQSGQERQTLNAGSKIRKLSFSNNGSYLNTNYGVLDIASTLPSASPVPCVTPALFVKNGGSFAVRRHFFGFPLIIGQQVLPFSGTWSFSGMHRVVYR